MDMFSLGEEDTEDDRSRKTRNLIPHPIKSYLGLVCAIVETNRVLSLRGVTHASKEKNVRAYGYRWAVLFVFGFVFMMSQLMWMAFSLVRSEVTPVMGLPAGDPSVVLLTASQPLVFIFISIPVGMLADRKGLLLVAGSGSIILTFFGTLRIFLIDDFMMVFICQLGLSVGAVMVQNCITYLSVHWFPRKERTLATGVSTLFMLLGMLIGSTMSLLLWSVPLYGQAGFTVALARQSIVSILTIQSILAVVFTVLFFLIARDRPKYPPDVEEVVTKKPSFMPMLKDRNVWVISYGFFVGMAIIIGLTAILETLLPSLGIPATVGLGNPVVIVQTLILAFAIAGSIIISGISDKVQRRKPFLLFSLFIGAIATLILGISTVAALSYVVAAILGFSLTSVMPVALSTLEEFKSVGPQLSGASAGLAFEFGNLGGFLGTLLLEALRVDTSYFFSILFLFIAAVIATGLVLIIPETARRAKPKK
nr:MFS transporter [Candidatus Njordarchaeum guaymaensis]